jgi:hypothetical protein
MHRPNQEDTKMKSPFPGMDPFIEAQGFWEDFHDDLISEIKRTLAPVVPERYSVRTGERAYIVLAGRDGKKEHLFQGDVGIISPAPGRSGTQTAQAAVAEPKTEADPGAVSLRAFIEVEFRESFIEIIEHEPERRLVTSIEVLSPSNKQRGSKGRKKYLRKRQALLQGEANFVEIDLLRGGEKMPMLDDWPASAYRLLVAREQDAPYCRVWPAHFQQPLPIIPVPLSRPDPDVSLELQPLIEAVYARSRYFRDVDYTRPLRPPLTDTETAWLQEQLRSRPASA